MSDAELHIHPSAVVQAGARLDAGVHIGPYCVVGSDVILEKNVRLEAHVSITGHTRIGQDCRFAPFTSIGTEPQDLGYRGDPTRVEIGRANTFKEFITVHRGTVKGGGVTRIGDGNYFMAYSHIAHDCRIGDETIFTNAATLGGHVEVGDFAVMGAFSGVHQFCRIGRYAFIGGFTVLTQDIPPFIRVAGMRPTHIYGLNAVGLRRRGFSRERIGALSDMIKILFYADLNTRQAAGRIEESFPPGPDRDELLAFLRSSKRGIIKKAESRWDPGSE